MGGPLVVRTAAAVPNRIGAGASFHGGGLVTDKPDSPHLLAPKIKARMYFGIASNDDQRQPDAKDKLKEAFAAANVPAEIEVYPDAARLVRPGHADAERRADLQQARCRARVGQTDRALQDGARVTLRRTLLELLSTERRSVSALARELGLKRGDVEETPARHSVGPRRGPQRQGAAGQVPCVRIRVR